MCGSFFLGSLVGSISIDPSYTHTRTRTILRHCLHKHPKKYNSWVSLCIYSLFCWFFFVLSETTLIIIIQTILLIIHSFIPQSIRFKFPNERPSNQPNKNNMFSFSFFFHLKSLKVFSFCVCVQNLNYLVCLRWYWRIFRCLKIIERQGESFSFTIHFISKE